MIRTHFAALSVALVALALTVSLAVADPPAAPIDEVTLYARVLPGATDSDEVATLVVDAATGQPVPGASVRWYPEDIRKTTTDYDVLLAEGVADANGVATIAWEAGRSDVGGKPDGGGSPGGHWIAIADGYAPEHEYGERPPNRMELRRGVPYVARLIDGWSRPIAGAFIEAWMGCAHGPTVLRARTDADGLFRLDPAPTSDMRLWIVVPGFEAPHVMIEDPGLGERPREIVLRGAAPVRGMVLDAAGRPLRGAVVRSYFDTERGPATRSADDGSFTLAGCQWESEVDIYHPLGRDPLRVRRIVADRLLRVRVAAIRPELSDDNIEVRASIRDENDKPVGGLFRLVNDEGISFDGWVAGETEGNSIRGEGSVRVPAGVYDVRTNSPFRSGLVPQRVAIAAGQAMPIVVRLRRGPRLVVDGIRENDDRVVIHLPYAAEDRIGQRWVEEEPIFLRPDAPAVVRQGDAWGIVGPVEAGNVRRAVLRTPPRHRVRWPAGLDVKEASLLYRGVPVIAERDGDSLVTRAAGDLTLRLEWKGDRKSVDIPVRLPVEPLAAVEVMVDPSTTSAAADDGISLSVLLADGTRPEQLKLTATDGKQNYSEAGSEPPLSLWGPLKMRNAVIRAEVDGLMPLVARIDRPGKHELRWGSGRLTLKVVDGDDKPVASSVLLDGELFELKDGLLAVGGLSAGAHRAIVASAQEEFRGREWKFSIADGQQIEKQLRLGEEK